MPEIMEIQVDELSELKTSKPSEKYPNGSKYFTVNGSQFICFKPDLHPVFANLQGQSVKCNITPSKGDKSPRIESLVLPDKGTTPQSVAKAPSEALQQPTVPIKPTSREENIQFDVAIKEIGELMRALPGGYPNLEEKYFAWLESITGAAPLQAWETKWIKKLDEIKPDMREKLFINLPKIIEKLSSKE